MEWTDSMYGKLEWCRTISNLEEKEAVAKKVVQRAKNGETVGVGTGSTSFVTLKVLAQKIREENLDISVIPAAAEVELACAALNIKTVSLSQKRPDWSFDGADEIDQNKDAIKGRGGGLFIEKLIIKSSPERYILVDNSKFVKYLGEKFPVPVEVYPAALHLAGTALEELGAVEVVLRLAKSKDGPVITEAGNYLLDVRFDKIGKSLENDIKSIPGVIESGLFIGYDLKIIRV